MYAKGIEKWQKGYISIGENGPNSWPTWSKIMSYISPKQGGAKWGSRDMEHPCMPWKIGMMGTC